MINTRLRYVFPLIQNCVHNIKTFTQANKNDNPTKCALYSFVTSRLSSANCGKNTEYEAVAETSDLSDANKFGTVEPFDISIITQGDPDLEKKLKILFLEVEILKQEGSYVPSSLKPSHWKELINMNTRSMRRRYLNFLFKTEMKRVNEKQRKLERRQKRDEERNSHNGALDTEPHIEYGLGKNTIFIRVYDTTMNHFYNNKLIQAIQFSQKLVVDCGYDINMTTRESVNCAKQLMLGFAENRNHSDPFNLYLCNSNREGHTLRELQKFIPPLFEDHFPLNVTEKSYLELFPKRDLVYLTPHCREEMVEFNHDTIYVIGAIVDKANKEPLSLAKAKQEGLRMAQLPLDRYLSWGSGSGKSLTINQMIRILLELRSSNDWQKALQHVPRRKVINYSEHREQYLDGTPRIKEGYRQVSGRNK